MRKEKRKDRREEAWKKGRMEEEDFKTIMTKEGRKDGKKEGTKEGWGRGRI